MGIIGSLIMGALVGWIAGKIMDAEGGLLRNIIVGIIGEYIAILFAEMKDRPIYIVKDTKNLDETNEIR